MSQIRISDDYLVFFGTQSNRSWNTRQSSCVTARGVPPAPPTSKSFQNVCPILCPKCLSNFVSKILSIFCPKLCPFFVGGVPLGAPPPQLGGVPPGAPPQLGGYPRGRPPSWGVVPPGAPPPPPPPVGGGGVPPGAPPPPSWGGGVPPGAPPPQLGGGTPGAPPPSWTDKLKTLPSRHTPYAGGNKGGRAGSVPLHCVTAWHA